MHRWACFCNTKALLLVSPSPLTRSALHPNAPWGEEAARRWLGNAEKLEFRERGGMGGGMEGWRWSENADLRGNKEDGVNDFSLAEKAEDTSATLHVLWHLEQLQLAMMPDSYFKTKYQSIYISLCFFLSLNFSYLRDYMLPWYVSWWIVWHLWKKIRTFYNFSWHPYIFC